MSTEPRSQPLAVGTLTLEITHRCHRRCGFCYVDGLQEQHASSRSELTKEQWLQLASTVLEETGCDHVQLSGGEPLLRRDLPELVQGLRRLGARVSLLTDGGLLTPDLARDLQGLGLARMQPTLLAAAPQVHDALRGAGSFAETTRAIAMAAAAGIRVTVCQVITRHNADQTSAVAELAFALGAETLALSRFCPAGAAAAAYEELMPDADAVRRATAEGVAAGQDLGLPVSAAITIPRCVFDDPERPPLRTGVCSLMGPKAPLTVGPDGQLRSCGLSLRPVGNLLGTPFADLAQVLWQEHLEPCRKTLAPVCRDCPHLPRCLGGCRLSALGAHGSLDRPDPLIPAHRLDPTG